MYTEISVISSHSRYRIKMTFEGKWQLNAGHFCGFAFEMNISDRKILTFKAFGYLTGRFGVFVCENV